MLWITTQCILVENNISIITVIIIISISIIIINNNMKTHSCITLWLAGLVSNLQR